MDFNLELPLNSLSFGNVSILLLREFFERGLNPNIFPIGNPDLSSQQISQEFGSWLQNGINRAAIKFNRKHPTFKLWHLNGSHSRISDKTVIFSFQETDSPTETELNIVSNLDKVLFSCDYTTNIFKDYGANNVYTVPLAFDKWNFNVKNKSYFNNRITVNIVGKYEHRKRTDKVIKTLAKRFGNNREVFFQFAIYNPFFSAEDNQKLFSQSVEGKSYFNFQFLGFMQDNRSYNDYLNSGNIVIGMSGSENFDLPAFHSVCLGKHAVIHNVTGYKEWANEDNSILVNPSSKIPVYDGVFFKPGPFNQGNVFDWDEDSFIYGLEKAIERVKANPINTKGLELQEKFSSKRMADSVLHHLFS